jgi:glycosyltransferase involved in cell wall biosynthesis
MKINFYDTDSRKNTDPAYSTNMGSFGVVAAGFNHGLKEIGAYAEPDDADWVGICDGLNMGFKYKDKKPFILNVWDQINVLPNELVSAQKHYNPRVLGLSNQVTNLWQHYGIDCETVMPGCDTEYWHSVCPKNLDKFTFLFNSFANVRSGLDLALDAFPVAFGPKDPVRLIIKNTSTTQALEAQIVKLLSAGYDIQYYCQRIPFNQMRVMYSASHISLNVMRHSSWGLGIHESMACGTISIVGDFCPSNEIVDNQHSLYLKPIKQVDIFNTIPNLVHHYGLHNAYGNFSYIERPRFYEYDISQYAELMKKAYHCYEEVRQPMVRQYVKDNWTWKKSAERLVEVLND